jgi:peptidoglycan/xylan/chitin deacetylase (PgdA/CDA1 family)
MKLIQGKYVVVPALCAIFGVVACSSSGASNDGAENGAESIDQEATTSYPQIDFTARPSYLNAKSVAFTFDDGPDYTNTAKVLDILKSNSVKSTFFINTKNWSNVETDAPMQDLVRRMVQEGHTLANHTVHHPHLGTLSAADVEAEISGVEATVKKIFGSTAPKLSLFRAPYGEPYQGNDPSNPSAAYKVVAPIVAKHAVQIGWAFDEFDYNCPTGDGACVLNNFKTALQGGAYGIVLMHAVHSQTVNALQQMIDYVRQNGYTIISVEDVVRARYGKSSAELVGGTTCTPACSGKVCGSNGCGGSCGSCASGQTCSGAGQCQTATCTPACSGKACGSDGCGKTCGSCATGQSCTSAGQCTTTSGSGNCAGVTAWDPNKAWYDYAVGELHTGSNNHLFACKNVAYCINDPTSSVGATYGWTDKGACQ